MDDKSSILPWNVTGIQKGSLQTITSDKLASFAIGANKKSRFQKNREEKEAKEKAEAQAAAQVYNSFVASFEGDDNDDDDNNQNMPLKAFVKESTSTTTTQIKSKTSNMDILFNEMKQKERNDVKRNTPYTNNTNNTTTNSNSNYINTTTTTTTSTTNNKDRVKEMDLFLEELKNKNANDYQRSENHLPSADDNISTNLYIGNINPNVTEERLYDLFSKYGDINSIKIMWPRSEEERIRRRNCGFVSFMKRKVLLLFI
jgi:U2-associated protein SR140